jgi:hypothetical protein
MFAMLCAQALRRFASAKVKAFMQFLNERQVRGSLLSANTAGNRAGKFLNGFAGVENDDGRVG